MLAQAGLGGLTVEKGLEDELVAAHLGLAMLLLGLLFVLRRGAETTPAPAAETVRGLRPLSIVTAALVLATIVAGGYVAGTEYHGTPTSRWSARTPPAGPGWSTDQFPGCNAPGPALLRPVAARRHPARPPAFMYLTAISVLAMAALALRRRAAEPRLLDRAARSWSPRSRSARSTSGPASTPGLIVGHLALGTTLWATVVYATATLMPASAPAPERVVRADRVRRCPPDGERDHNASPWPASAPPPRRSATTSR